MNVDINTSWKPYLKDEFEKPYFKDLVNFIKTEYDHNKYFPPRAQIFNAFNCCSFKSLKVVIIGQDPYHGCGQSNGLSFSVNDSVKHPPSLINIFKEIEQDLGIPYPKSGNLMRWAEQGVLLMNSALTVRANQAGSHQNKGWETFTDAVIKLINDKKEGVIFLLWGGYAIQKMKYIGDDRHNILVSVHPSPLSANRGYWFVNKHFSKTNFLLEQVFRTPIQW